MTSQGRRRPLRVIVIDDLADTVMLLLTLLRGEGYNVEGFGSGGAALKHVKKFDPDVVISDIAMPSVNGWELASEIRRIMGDTRPMLIAISGKYIKGTDRVLAQNVGYNYYLTKPYDPRVLMELLELAASGL
jgi:CheY-like chemotaxis protein